MKLRDTTQSVGLLVVAALLSGCGTISTSTSSPPAYVQAAENYRHFSSSDELAAYLRYDSYTGPHVSAHRGGSAPGFPENAIATFDRSLKFSPAFLECDVRMTRDSVLVLMHDDTLERTTTGSGKLADYDFADVRRLLLRDSLGVITPFRIPTLDEALAWADGRTVFTLDIKRVVPPAMVVDAIRKNNAENRSVVIIYDIEDIDEYLELAPDLTYSVPTSSMDAITALENSNANLSRVIGWVGVGEVEDGVIERLHSLNVKAMIGTFGMIDGRALRGGADVYARYLEAGVDVIATDNAELASRATNEFSARD